MMRSRNAWYTGEEDDGTAAHAPSPTGRKAPPGTLQTQAAPSPRPFGFHNDSQPAPSPKPRLPSATSLRTSNGGNAGGGFMSAQQAHGGGGPFQRQDQAAASAGGGSTSTTVTTKTSVDAEGRTVIVRTTVTKHTTATGSRTETSTETTTLPRGMAAPPQDSPRPPALEVAPSPRAPAAAARGGTPRAPSPGPRVWDTLPDSPTIPTTPSHITRRISGGGAGKGSVRSSTPSHPTAPSAQSAYPGAPGPTLMKRASMQQPAAAAPVAAKPSALRASWPGQLEDPKPSPRPPPANARAVSVSSTGIAPAPSPRAAHSYSESGQSPRPPTLQRPQPVAAQNLWPQSPSAGSHGSSAAPSPSASSILSKMSASGMENSPSLAGPPGASLRRSSSFGKSTAPAPAAAPTAKPAAPASPAKPAAAPAAKPVTPQPATKPTTPAAAPAKPQPPAAPRAAPAAPKQPPAAPPSPSKTAAQYTPALSATMGRRNAGYCAVSLAFLKRFRAKIVKERPDHLTIPTYKVVYEVIQPLTKPHVCRLTDLPDKSFIRTEDVGQPEYFISHAWGMPFLQLVDAVFNHLQGALDSTHVWLDIFAVSQHPGAEQKDDLSNLRTAIMLSQATLVVLDSAGTPLERVWCLYEFDNTLELKGADGLVLMTPGFSVREIASIFRSIDVDNAKATVASDKSMILADIIKRHGSTQAFNAKLKLRFLLDPLDMKPDITAMASRAGADPSQWNFTPMAQWLAQAGGAQVALVTAPAGTGKSTLSSVLCLGPEVAAGLAASAAQDGSLARPTTAALAPRPSAKGGIQVHAYHFCNHGDARRQDPVRIVKTLAYQLAHVVPAMQGYYCGLDPDQLMQLNEPDTACRELLLVPIQKFCRGQQILLVLDALDEADKQQGSGHTGAAGPSGPSALDNKALQLLLHQLSLLPPSVRILTTLRPERHLVEPLRSRFPRLLELALPTLRRADKTSGAMQARLVERFGREAAEKLLAAAAQDAAGGNSNLIFFPVVLLLQAPLGKIPSNLYDAYATVFDQLWPKGSNGQQVQQILEVLVAAQEPPPLSLLAAMGLQGAIAALPGWGVLFLERDHQLHMLHRTLKDWLQDKRTAGKRYSDARLGHRALGRHLLSAPRPLITYGARYLVSHLIMAGSEPALLDKALQDTGYLEQACREGNVFMLHTELASLPEQRQTEVVRDVVRWLGLNGLVLWSHPAAVVQLAAEAPRRSSICRTATTSSRTSGSGATRSSAPGVSLLNRPNGWPLQVMALTQHSAPVSDVAYSPDGSLMVSASQSQKGTIRFWSASSGEPKAVLNAPAAHCLAYSPSGHLLATGGEEGAMQLWDPTTGVQRAEMRGHRDLVTVLAFSVDGSTLASGSKDKSVRLWATFNGTQRAELKGHTGAIVALTWSPDGLLLASAAAGDPVIRLWDASAGSLRSACEGHRLSVHSLAYSPSGSMLASGSEDCTVRLWDGDTGALRAALTDHLFPVKAVAFSPDGRSLASADSSHTVRLWDLASSPRPTTKAGPRGGKAGGGGPRQSLVMEIERSGQLTAMAYSPCSSLLATGSVDGELHVFDTVGGGVSTVRAAHAGAVRRLAFSPNSKALVSASDDCTVRLWDPHTAAQGQAEGAGDAGGTAGAWAVHYTRGGRVAACLGEDGSLTLWDAGAAAVMAPAQRVQGSARPCCSRLSPDEGTLAVGESDGYVRLWDLGSGKLTARLKGHTDKVRDLAFAPAGDVLASASEDCRVRLWRADNGQQLTALTGHTSTALSVAIEPGAKFVASGAEDGSIRVWNITNLGATMTKAVVLKGHTGHVLRLAFAPGGASGPTLASGGADGSVRLWDAGTGAELAVLQGGHREGVRKLAWGPSGRLLASASRGQGAAGTVCVWSVQQRKQVWSAHASDLCEDGAAAGGTKGIATVVSNMEHAPHLTIVSEGPGKAVAAATPPAPGSSDRSVVADGQLELRQVPVYTSFATPAAIAVHRSSVVMAFGGQVNIYKY